MAPQVLPAGTTAFGKRVRRRLRDESVVWLTTVADDGTPQPNPVWFWWDGSDIIVYSRPDAYRLRHVRRRPNVTLHFDSNGRGGDIVVIAGTADLDADVPASHELPQYLAKYRDGMIQVSGSTGKFGATYSEPMRISPRRVRGY